MGFMKNKNKGWRSLSSRNSNTTYSQRKLARTQDEESVSY